MKKKVNSAESGKAIRRKGSKEVNPFESEDCEVRRRNKTVPSADGKYRANPFRVVENSIKEDSVSFEFEETPADDEFIETPASEAAELSEKTDRRMKVRTKSKNAQEIAAAESDGFESEDNLRAAAPVTDTESDETPAKSAREKVKRVPTPAESEAAAKKIWLVESVAAILASFLALIVASIY